MCAMFGNRYKTEDKAGAELNPAEKFLQEFETTEEEMTVLVKDFSKGGIGRGDYLFTSIWFIAYIDNKSGEVVQEKGTLNWVIPQSSKNYIHKFEDYGICRVLVRKSRPDVMTLAGKPWPHHCYYIVKIIEQNVAEPRLEAIREKYLAPVSIEDRTGTFCLDRKYDWFKGQIDWLGTPKEILLDKDSDSDTAEKALRTLHLFLDNAEKWDKILRDYAAQQLTELANDWRQEDDPEITEEEFSKRIGIPKFHINDEGSFEAEYEDDDMFGGHWVVVYGDEDGTLKEAKIEG